MGKKSSGDIREQKLSDRIKEMEKIISDFQPEYDEKKKQLDDLNEEIRLAKEELNELVAKYKEEAKAEVEKECRDNINDANATLESALKKEEAANALTKEAERKYNETIDKIKEDKKAFEAAKKESDQLANEYSAKVHQEADQYYTEKNNDITNREKVISSREKELDSFEKNLKKKEHEQAELQNQLDKRQQDAELGFKVDLRKERVKFDEELSRVKAEIAEQEKKKIQGQEAIDDELAKYKDKELVKINADIQKQKDDIVAQKKSIQDTNAKLEIRKADLDAEAEVIKTKKEAYDRKYAKLDDLAEEKVQELYKDVIEARDTFKDRCNELQTEVAEKQKLIVSLTAKLKAGNGVEVNQLKEEINKLNEEIDSLRDSETSIIGKLKKYKVDSASLVKQLFKIEEYDNLMAQFESLNKENHRLDLELRSARKNDDALELEVKRANQYQSNYENAIAELDRLKKPSRKDRLSSFTSFDEFDTITKLDPFGAQLSELNWLKNIKEKMEQAEIKISNKLLYAFHTSIKIHDWSPLVVLAGVSGTGKSELPRQYAHHGGMNFISVPVKPDWDSMQSLFGYYNSIENKFEPTELSRAIYYMQSAEMKNTMLLVLLDEMNLAYVELYFSDLLSKFETNRGTNDTITYEISLGANEPPEKMQIGKNILWVGTMNEDETTKALSDKVVDRSTLITFPRPKTLVSRRSDIKIPDTEKRLTHGVWEKWCANILTEEQLKNKGFEIDKYRKIIEDINDQMSKVNRNLGHRVWQSIERYVFSHPMTVSNIDNGSQFKRQFDSAFAEAVAFKVMPKLRGIEVSGESKKVLESINTIILQEIPSLADDFKQAMSLSSRIFQWSSAKFMDVEEEKVA